MYISVKENHYGAVKYVFPSSPTLPSDQQDKFSLSSAKEITAVQKSYQLQLVSSGTLLRTSVNLIF